MDEPPKRTDRELVERARWQDRGAFEELYRRYEARVFAYLWRKVRDEALAADLRQEAFLRLWEARATLKAEESVGPYLMRVARNLAIDHARHASVRQRWSDLVEREPVQSSPAADVVVERRELAAQVNAAVDALPPRMREVFTLKRDAGLSYAEIARMLDISPKTVDRHMSNALKRLRDALAHLMGDDPGTHPPLPE